MIGARLQPYAAEPCESLEVLLKWVHGSYDAKKQTVPKNLVLRRNIQVTERSGADVGDDTDERRRCDCQSYGAEALCGVDELCCNVSISN